MANEYNPRRISPPGGTIEDLIEERELDPVQIALGLGLDQAQFEALLSGELAIEQPLVGRLETVFGVEADFWIARERSYREWVNRQARLAV